MTAQQRAMSTQASTHLCRRVVPFREDGFEVLVAEQREPLVEPRKIIVGVRVRLRLDVLRRQPVNGDAMLFKHL